MVIKERRNSRGKDKKIDIGWRLSTRQDAEDLSSHVRAALKRDLVYTVQLQDGYMDVDYEGEFKLKDAKQETQTNVKKLTIKGSQFKVVDYHRNGYDGWRLASKQDVMDQRSNVRRALKNTRQTSMSYSVGLQVDSHILTYSHKFYIKRYIQLVNLS